MLLNKATFANFKFLAHHVTLVETLLQLLGRKKFFFKLMNNRNLQVIWSFRRYRGPHWDLILPWIRIDHGHLRYRLLSDHSLLLDLKSFLHSIHVNHIVILYLNLLVLIHVLDRDQRRFEAFLSVESLLALLGWKSLNRLDVVERWHHHVLFVMFNIDIRLHSHDWTLRETDSIKLNRPIILLRRWQLFKTQVNDHVPHSVDLHLLTFLVPRISP